jgi:four helix bundle protein
MEDMEPRSRSFRDLLVWQQAMGLAKECYGLTSAFPKAELYGMTSQIRRAAVSVPANIAEGSGRGTRKDYLSFLRIAEGSLRELETLMLLSVDVQLVDQAQMEPALAQLASVGRLLHRLIRSLQDP